jgi:hypothetical protein
MHSDSRVSGPSQAVAGWSRGSLRPAQKIFPNRVHNHRFAACHEITKSVDTWRFLKDFFALPLGIPAGHDAINIAPPQLSTNYPQVGRIKMFESNLAWPSQRCAFNPIQLAPRRAWHRVAVDALLRAKPTRPITSEQPLAQSTLVRVPLGQREVPGVWIRSREPRRPQSRVNLRRLPRPAADASAWCRLVSSACSCALGEMRWDCRPSSRPAAKRLAGQARRRPPRPAPTACRRCPPRRAGALAASARAGAVAAQGHRQPRPSLRAGGALAAGRRKVAWCQINHGRASSGSRGLLAQRNAGERLAACRGQASSCWARAWQSSPCPVPT